MDFKCEKIRITDLCNVERAISGKKYKAGSCYIKLSAVDEFVGQIFGDEEIGTRFVVFEPKEQINTDYLYIAITKSFPEFLRKYRTTINLQFDALKHFTLYWHQSVEVQKYIIDAIRTVDNEITLVENQLINTQMLKRWYLRKMMV